MFSMEEKKMIATKIEELLLSLNHPEKEMRVVIYGEGGNIVYDPLLQPVLRTAWYKRS